MSIKSVYFQLNTRVRPTLLTNFDCLSKVYTRALCFHAFCQGVLFGCFSSFLLAFCSCLLIFCFRPLSLSFLPLSPIAYLLFLLSLIFSPRGHRCVVSSVFAYFHEYSCLANDADQPPLWAIGCICLVRQ